MTEKEQFCSTARRIFAEVFHEYGISQKSIDESIRLPENDPGEWAPTSLLIVCKESGIPDRFYYPKAWPLWEDIEHRLSELLKQKVFFEEINAAVAALYPV